LKSVVKGNELTIIDLLKGEQVKPNVRGNKKVSQGDVSSEKERKKKKENPRRKRIR